MHRKNLNAREHFYWTGAMHFEITSQKTCTEQVAASVAKYNPKESCQRGLVSSSATLRADYWYLEDFWCAQHLNFALPSMRTLSIVEVPNGFVVIGSMQECYHYFNEFLDTMSTQRSPMDYWSRVECNGDLCPMRRARSVDVDNTYDTASIDISCEFFSHWSQEQWRSSLDRVEICMITFKWGWSWLPWL